MRRFLVYYDFEVLAAMLVPLSAAPRWPLHTFFTKRLILVRLQLLNKMFLHFKIWPRCVVLNSLQFHKHFGIKICCLSANQEYMYMYSRFVYMYVKQDGGIESKTATRYRPETIIWSLKNEHVHVVIFNILANKIWDLKTDFQFTTLWNKIFKAADCVTSFPH